MRCLTFFFQTAEEFTVFTVCIFGNKTSFCATSQIRSIPAIYRSNGVCIFRANNRISGISEEQLGPFASLETLDLSSNKIVEIKTSSFPALPLMNL